MAAIWQAAAAILRARQHQARLEAKQAPSTSRPPLSIKIYAEI